MLVQEELVLSLNPLVGDRASLLHRQVVRSGSKIKQLCDVLF